MLYSRREQRYKRGNCEGRFQAGVVGMLIMLYLLCKHARDALFFYLHPVALLLQL